MAWLRCVLNALRAECAALASMPPESGRNAKLNRIAFRFGQFVAGGELLEAEAEAELQHAARISGLAERALLATIRSGFEKGKLYPRSAPEKQHKTTEDGVKSPDYEWPQFVPFDERPRDLPPDIVPGFIGDFAKAAAEAIQVPLELAAFNALGVVALALQKKFIVRVKPDYAEGLNLYAIVASEPGERKSAIVDACKSPVLNWEEKQQELAKDAIREAKSARKTYEKIIDSARSKASRAKDSASRKLACEEIAALERELPEIPVFPRFFVDDCTPEAMSDVFAASNGNFAMLEA